MIVGDFDSVSDAALRCGAELLVHAYADGRAPGSERLAGLGLPFATVAAPGISEDIALLLAHDRGAELIVAVGTHFNLVEFMERNRAGMASTFVTRLKVGESLVDAKGVSRLVSARIGIWPLVVVRRGGDHRRRRRDPRLAGAPQRDPVARPLDRQRARALDRAGDALASLHSLRVRPPLPRRLADGGVRRARRRDPRRRRPLGEGIRQRRRAREPDQPDRRPAPRARRRPRRRSIGASRGALAPEGLRRRGLPGRRAGTARGTAGRGALRRPGRPGRLVRGRQGRARRGRHRRPNAVARRSARREAVEEALRRQPRSAGSWGPTGSTISAARSPRSSRREARRRSGTRSAR